MGKLDGSFGHLKKLDIHWHKHFLHFADCSVNETCIYTVIMAARVPFAVRNLAALRPAPVSSMPSISQQARRQFQSSRTLLADATAPKKPVGAFRGSLFGFLAGSVLAGSALYYYVIDEYKVSNELLTEDIYALQSAVQRIESYVKTLEEEVKSKK